MNLFALITIVLLALVPATYAAMPSAPHAQCVIPTPQQFMRAYQRWRAIPKDLDPMVGDAQVVSQRFVDQPDRTWFGLEWFGPTSGLLSVINCRGEPVASLDLGGVEQIRVGPLLPDGKRAYVVEYTSGTGTGFVQREVALVHTEGGRISIVWCHTIYELVSGWPGTADHEDRFTWRYLPKKGAIAVRGWRKTVTSGGERPSVPARHLRTTIFPWIPDHNDFGRCAQNPRS